MPEDYDQWTKESGKHRVLLCDVEAYLDGSVQTLHFSTFARGDYGYYESIIDRTPILIRRVEADFASFLYPGTGFIDLAIADGRQDDLIYANMNNRPIKFYHGDASWSKDDFRNIFTGVVTKLEIMSDRVLRVNFEDGSGEFDTPITQATVSTTLSGDVSPPMCYGECFNVTPLQLDDTTFDYQINHGPVEDCCVQLYVNAEPSAISVTKDNANGTFSLASDPGGTVTCDVLGMAPSAGATRYSTPGEIVQDLLTRFGHMTIDNIDTASIAAFDAESPDIGLYFLAEDNLVSTMEGVVKTRLGWFNFNRQGMFSLNLLQEPSGQVAVVNFDDNNIIDNVYLKHDDKPPTWRTMLSYAKNWTVQTNTDADATRREFVEKEFRTVSYEDPNAAQIQAEYADAKKDTGQDTFIVTEADALAEATRRQALSNVQRYWVQPKATASGLTAEIGDIGSVTSSRFFLNDRKYVIMSLDDDMLNSTVEIGGWF